MSDRPLLAAVAHLQRHYDRLRGECSALRAEQRRLQDRIGEIDDELVHMRSAPAPTADDEFRFRRQFNHYSTVAEEQKTQLRGSVEAIEHERVRPLLEQIRVVSTRKAGLEKLLERRRSERERLEARREQALMDEFASRRHWRTR